MKVAKSTFKSNEEAEEGGQGKPPMMITQLLGLEKLLVESRVQGARTKDQRESAAKMKMPSFMSPMQDEKVLVIEKREVLHVNECHMLCFPSALKRFVLAVKKDQAVDPSTGLWISAVTFTTRKSKGPWICKQLETRFKSKFTRQVKELMCQSEQNLTLCSLFFD